MFLLLGLQSQDAPDGFTLTPLFPLTQGLAPYARSPAFIVGPGNIEVSTALTWANTFRYDDGYYYPGYFVLVDGESLVEKSSLRAGLTPGFEIESWVEGSLLYPGYFDTQLSSFHKAFGFPNQGREYFPPNQLDILVDTPNGQAYHLTNSIAGLTSWGLGLNASLPQGLPFTLSIRAKFPTNAPSPWYLSQTPSFGGSISWRLDWTFALAVASAGLSWQSPSSLSNFFAQRSILLQGGGALFFTLTQALVLGVEVSATESPYAVDEQFLGGIVGNTWFGGFARLGKDLWLELAMIEELASWASVEVGFTVGLRWRLPQGNMH